MIIKGERVAAARKATPLLRHLLHGEENDRVTLVQGTEEDTRVAFADARNADKKFALRHFIISPESETSRADAMMILGLLAREFAFDPATAIVWEHDKPRAVATFGTHWHALVPEIIDTPAGSRVMDSRFSYLRHCKVARIAEHLLKQNFVRSNHELACLAALESDGHLDVAAALRTFIENDPGEAHREAFSRGLHQMGKRQGIDIPAARAVVRAAWETTASWTAFTAALDADGLRITTGDRAGTLIVETRDGIFVGAAHRLARARKVDLQRRKDEADERTSEIKSDPGGHPVPKAATGPSDRVLVAHGESAQGNSVESRSAAPQGGRGGALYPTSVAVSLRIALKRNPRVVRQLLDSLRQLARSPQERVRAKLDARENYFQAELQKLISPVIAFPILDDARKQVTLARAECDKFKQSLNLATEQRAQSLLERPTGVMASIRGEKRAWSEHLTKINAKMNAFKDQERLAWKRYAERKEIVADLEKELLAKKHQLMNLPSHQQKLSLCRRELTRISVARQLLEKDPLVALGGLTMLLAAAAIAIISDGLIGRRFATEGHTP